MMIGISIAVFAEINFSLLTPFILNEFNYTTKEIAIFMSVLATVDICCRFISPFIGDYFKQPPRIMYMYALLMLIITRSCLLFVDTYQGILTVAVGLGVAKGVRSVYMSLGKHDIQLLLMPEITLIQYNLKSFPAIYH